jgi:hypothetical protein
VQRRAQDPSFGTHQSPDPDRIRLALLFGRAIVFERGVERRSRARNNHARQLIDLVRVRRSGKQTPGRSALVVGVKSVLRSRAPRWCCRPQYPAMTLRLCSGLSIRMYAAANASRGRIVAAPSPRSDRDDFRRVILPAGISRERTMSLESARSRTS